MWWVSAVSLFIIMISCAAGAFAPKEIFNDNPAQRIGMAGVFFFALPRFIQLMERQEFTANCMSASAQLAGHVGLALYCVGTAIKVMRHKPKRKPPLPPISTKHLHSVRGGGK
jgi:hypothetical protein